MRRKKCSGASSRPTPDQKKSKKVCGFSPLAHSLGHTLLRTFLCQAAKDDMFMQQVGHHFMSYILIACRDACGQECCGQAGLDRVSKHTAYL